MFNYCYVVLFAGWGHTCSVISECMADVRYDSDLAQFTLKCSLFLVLCELVTVWGLRVTMFE